MSNSHVSNAIYAMILTIGAMFIPLQFGYATNLQSVISHTCDQSHIVAGCGNGASYRAVQETTDEQQTTSNGNSNSSDAFAGFAGVCSDRRHCPSAASTP
jgi:hypothetical protein